MKKLWQLIRKDWRLNRPTVVGLLIVMVLSYALGGAAYLWDRYETVVSTPVRPPHSQTVPFTIDIGAPLSSYMRTAAVMGLLFVALAAAVFGGAAFAIERRERSADFLAMLPVKRREIVTSKLLVAFGVLGAALAIEMGVLLFSDFQRQWETLPDLLMATFDFAASGLAIFGVAWLLSTFMSSTAIAASVAIVAAGCVSILFSVVLKHFVAEAKAPGIAMCVVCGMAMIFLLIGSLYYLRRVAP